MNILVDQKYGIKLTDFGLSKVLEKKKNNKRERANSIWGTIQYLAPEVALGNEYQYSIDWWSFGVIIYEMISGKLPFDNKEESMVVKNIISKSIKFKKWFSEEAQDLVTKLLQKDPKARLGSGGAEEVMKHPFFKDIVWADLLSPEKETEERIKTPRGYSKYWYGQSAESSVISEKGMTKFDIPNFTFVENEYDEISAEGSSST